MHKSLPALQSLHGIGVQVQMGMGFKLPHRGVPARKLVLQIEIEHATQTFL
jgi:hypothetical protein